MSGWHANPIPQRVPSVVFDGCVPLVHAKTALEDEAIGVTAWNGFTLSEFGRMSDGPL